MTRLRFILADVVLAIAEFLYPDELPDDAVVPFFDEDAPLVRQWAGLIVLHAEAVHGCDHTAQARAGIGMAGPRGERAAS